MYVLCDKALTRNKHSIAQVRSDGLDKLILRRTEVREIIRSVDTLVDYPSTDALVQEKVAVACHNLLRLP